MSESCTLAKKRGIRVGAWGKKGGLYRERRQVLKKGESKEKVLRSRGKHEQVSGSKSSPRRSAESSFHSKSGQT